MLLVCRQLAEVDDTIADMFKDQIETPLAIVTALHYACYGFGPLLALAPLVWILGRRMRARRQVSNDSARFSFALVVNTRLLISIILWHGEIKFPPKTHF